MVDILREQKKRPDGTTYVISLVSVQFPLLPTLQLLPEAECWKLTTPGCSKFTALYPCSYTVRHTIRHASSCIELETDPRQESPAATPAAAYTLPGSSFVDSGILSAPEPEIYIRQRSRFSCRTVVGTDSHSRRDLIQSEEISPIVSVRAVRLRNGGPIIKRLCSRFALALIGSRLTAQVYRAPISQHGILARLLCLQLWKELVLVFCVRVSRAVYGLPCRNG